MKLTMKLLLLLPFLTVLSSASSYEYYKAEDFEIYGLKFGDQAEQVIEKLTAHFSISIEELTIDDFGNGIEYVEYRNDTIRVRAWIEPEYDPTTNLPVEGSVRNLDLLWIDWQNDDYKKFGNELIKKYGPPTIPPSFPSEIPAEKLWRWGYFWCEKLLASETDCEAGSPALFVRSNDVNSKGTAIWVENYE